MRGITLNATNAGMTRLREKGGADPRTLYELTNGYVNASKVPTQRPGTRWIYTWPARTCGLMAFKDVLYAFSTQIIDTGRDDFKVLTLRHPDSTFEGDVYEINFNAPMLGYPIVSATFRPTGADDDSTDTTYLYWLRVPDKWKANTMYKEGDRVEPATANGYYYEAHASENPPAWAPGVERAVGDVVQPTTYNGFKYTVVDTSDAGAGGGGGDDGGAEPFGRINTATITYVPSGTGSRDNAPITTWENVFGHSTATDDEVAFPGRSDSAPVLRIPRDGYVALQIDVPGDFDTSKYGWVTHTEYNFGADLTVSISTTPGDFNPATALTVVDLVGAATLAQWHGSTATSHGGALVEPGNTYYYNIKVKDPSAPWRDPPGNQPTNPVGFANEVG
jgi:hypothetical protein